MVGVEQEEVRTAHLALPDACRKGAAREGDLDGHPVVLRVADGGDGELLEILGLVGRLLRAVGRQTLGEVTVAVEQTHGDHRNVLVRSLLQVVAGQNAQTARVDLQRRVQTVLHREVGDGRDLRIGLFIHVCGELAVHGVKHRQEALVVLQFVQAVHREPVEQGDRIAVHLVPEFVVDIFEQIAGAGRPTPPEVARELLQRAQAGRQALLDHQTAPVGALGDQLLLHEVDLLVLCAALVQHGAVRARNGVLDRLGISLLVSREEVLPQGGLRYGGGRLAGLLHLVGRKGGEAQQGVGDVGDSLLVVIVVAADHLDAGVLLELVDPQTEAGQRGGDGRHGEGHRLQRGVAPRFVVGGEYRDVHADEQLVVVLVEDAVGLVQIGRNEDHLHLRIDGRKVAVVDSQRDGIPGGLGDVVGRVFVLRGVDGDVRVGQVGLEVQTGAVVGGRYGDVGQDLAAELVRCGQLSERLEEDVEPLVVEFVAARGADDERIGREFRAQAGLGHPDHRFAGLLALGVVLLAAPYEVVLESVGRHAVHLATQQVLALVGRDVAHG